MTDVKSTDGPADGETCPAIAALARYAEGGPWAEGEGAPIAEHLPRCAACRARVAEIREAEDFLRRLRPGSTAARLTPTDAREAGAGPTSPIAEIAERPGSVVGHYTLLEQIGEGGFGVVFSAQQNEPVSRRVALKILKPGMDSRQVLARFEAERHTLALMDHPNIARVLDAGVTGTGRPYFVMELVEGVPITRYCDDAKLTIRERLELFRAVCAAVQHAHQKGVIHRDIKPSNVMVAVQDGLPVPKVIDFGIAKATDQHLAEQAAFTRLGQFIGTPEYTSPEQAAGPSDDIDTRSDVYSLGVLLYELLTGATPLDPERLRSAGLAEMQRVIREGETPRPSTRLSTIGGLDAVAASRRIDPRRLALQLRGELDWILLKTLEKDRARRYDTVAALGEDLRRYLENEPVQAGPPTLIYRVRKFVRRNRVPMFAGAGLATMLLVGLAGTSIGLMQATNAERRRSAEATWANRVASLQATPFLSPRMREAYLTEWESRLGNLRETLPSDHPDMVRQQGLIAVWGWDAYVGDEVKATITRNIELEIANAKVTYLDFGLESDIEAPTSIFTPLPAPLLSREASDQAQRWGVRLVQACLQARKHLDESDPLWIALLNDLIQWQLISDASVSDLASSYEMLARACDAAHGESSTSSLGALCAWAAELAEAGGYSQGLSVLEEYVRRRRGAPIAPTREHYVQQRRLIVAFADHNESDLFGEFVRAHFEDVKTLSSWGDPRFTGAALDWGSWLYARNRYAEAEAVYSDLTGAIVRTPTSALYAAGPLYRLGLSRMQLGRLTEAEASLREALVCIEQSGRREYEYQVEGALGGCLRDQGRYDEAEPLLLAAYEGSLPNRPRDPDELRGYTEQLADFYARWNRPADAEAWRRSAAEQAFVPRVPENLGFENAGETGIPGWYFRQGAASLSSEKPAEGLLCAELRPPPAVGASEARPYNAIMLPFSAIPFRGKRIRITALLRVEAESIDGRAQLVVNVLPKEIDGWHYHNASFGWGAHSLEWNRYGLTFPVHNDACLISFGVLAIKDATVWIDDVRIEVVEPDGSTTQGGVVTDVPG